MREITKEDIIYVSGPMSGIEEHNYPLFRKVSKELRDQGYNVISPHETDNEDTSGTWEYYIRKDIISVAKATAIVLLPNWHRSKGVAVELFLAQQLKMPIVTYPDMVPLDLSVLPQLSQAIDLNESIVEEAQRLVGGDRQQAYGHPYWDFLRTSTMWTGLLIEKLKDGVRIEPEEVGMMMNILKLSRHMNKKKRDNLVDAHGYLITVDMVEKFKNETKT